MEADSNPLQKLRFKAFLSHAYEAEQLNIEFFKIFQDVADVQFEVDIGLKNLNVTRLEHRIRDCDAFVGLYPFPREQTYEPSTAETLEESRYFRLKMELAARAGRPSIVYYDKRFRPAIQSLEGFSEYAFSARDVHSAMTTRYRSEIKTAFGDFCSRLEAEIRGRVTFEAKHRRRGVGLLVPRGRGGYPKKAIRAIEEVAAAAGYPQLLDLGWPPVADASLFDQLDSLEWMFVDVGPRIAATGILGVVHGRFIPAVRMRRGRGPLDAQKWVSTDEVSGLFGGSGVGYRKDIVYWQDADSLNTQLHSRVQVALKPPSEHEVIRTPKEALDYFRLATTEKRPIFVSYAGEDRSTAEKLVAMMGQNFPTVFDYLDRGKSLPPGTQWRDEIKQTVLGAQSGVLLISQAYKESKYCDWEKNLLLDAHMERDMPLFPVLLDVRARDMPTGLESLQPERFQEGDTPEEVALRLVEVMKKKPQPKNESP